MQRRQIAWQQLVSKRYFPIVLLAVIGLVASLSLWRLYTAETITIQNPTVTLRERPITTAKGIATLAKDSVAHIVKREQNWVRLRSGQQEGWVADWLLQRPELASDQGVVALTVQATSLYQSQNTSSKVLAEVAAGSQYDVMSESLGWTQIVIDNQQGYVQTKYLDLKAKASANAQPEVIKTDEVSIDKSEYIQVRAAGNAFLQEADVTSKVLYNPDYNQRFKYLKEVTGADGTEFYQVEDNAGQKGYIEARIVALESASKEHVAGPSANSLNGAVVLLDAGHGGTDSGAVHRDEPYTEEKTITLASMKVLKAKLEEKGALVRVTRDSDQDVSLEDRTNLSNQEAVDAFISLHFDDAEVDNISGITTYFYHTADEQLANLVNTELAKVTDTANKVVDNNGVLFGNYYVLRENHQPSILLELGYMSSARDIELIQEQSYYEKVADAIVAGLEQYLKVAHVTAE